MLHFRTLPPVWLYWKLRFGVGNKKGRTDSLPESNKTAMTFYHLNERRIIFEEAFVKTKIHYANTRKI